MKKNKKIISLLVTAVYFFISIYCFSLLSDYIESYKPFTVIESTLFIIFAIIGNIIMFGGSFLIFNLLIKQKSKDITLTSLKYKDDKSDYIIKKNSENKIPPETRFRTARKINWEDLLKDKMKTGLKGEEIIFRMEKNYLQSIDKRELAEKVTHVSQEKGDGLGYDILSFFNDGRKKYIEVKTTSSKIKNSYNISRNELSFLKENPDQSFIYRLSIQDEFEPTLEIILARDFITQKELIPTSYQVK